MNGLMFYGRPQHTPQDKQAFLQRIPYFPNDFNPFGTCACAGNTGRFYVIRGGGNPLHKKLMVQRP
jgi:hypothetical protein